MQQYLIHEDNMERLTKKLQTIENKCKKYGIQFHFAEIGEEFIEFCSYKSHGEYYEDKVTDKNRKSLMERVDKKEAKISIRRFVLVEVEGIAKINDWEFIGTIEHTSEGNLIKQYKTDVEVPAMYRFTDSICEHCNSDRYRKDTYIVQNTITKEFKQVGKSCLLSFTNGLSAENVANFLSYFDKIAEFDMKESMGGYVKEYLNVKDCLLYAIETVKFHGFISAKKREEIYNDLTKGLQPEEIEYFEKEISNIPSTTSSQTLEYMNADKAEWGSKLYNDIKVKMADMKFQADSLQNNIVLTEMLNWLNSQNADSQYISNLQVLCKLEWCEFKNCGLLVSLCAAYYNAMNKKVEAEKKEEKNKLSNFVGNIGDKIEIKNAIIKRTGGFETQYGFTAIFTITDENNNVYVWFTGSYNNDEEEDKDKKVTIKGTVKEHKLYGILKQTVLTRCKVIE